MSYGDAIGNAVLAFMIVPASLVAVVILSIWGLVEFLSDDAIRSNRRIKPEIELVIVNNKIDTVFIYNQP